MNEKATTPQDSFKAYLLSRRNKIMLYIAAAAIIIQFAVFKYIYPYPSYIPDSLVYLETSSQGLAVNTHLVGYSWFLFLVHVFTNSDTALVALQYLLIQSSALFLLFTLFYFYKPGRVVQTVLGCFMVLNPLFLHLANLVSSEGFFLALSLTWFALLLWIIHRPDRRVVIWHTLVLAIAFTVSYSALIYPVIAALAFLLSKQSVLKKIAGIGAGILLCGLFMWYTGNQYKTLTGAWQYAPGSSWLIASNALSAYRNIDSANRKPVPARFNALDNTARTYFDNFNRMNGLPKDLVLYMSPPGSVLNIYRDSQFKKDTTVSDLKKWATVAPLYADYGNYIIRQYPWQYTRYVLWPNANKYNAPQVEVLQAYNAGIDTIPRMARKWFGYKRTRAITRTKDLQISTLEFYPIFSGVLNMAMLCSLLYFAILNGFQMNMLFRKGILLAATVWLLNAGFTIFTSAATLRSQSFPILLTSVFTLLLVDWCWKISVHEKKEGQLLAVTG